MFKLSTMCHCHTVKLLSDDDNIIGEDKNDDCVDYDSPSSSESLYYLISVIYTL